MIYTLTLNPSLDYILKTSQLGEGDVGRAQSANIFAGGKGINVSLILSHLGVPSKALGFVGGFTGEELERILAHEGVETDFLHLKSGNTRINVKIRADQEIDVNAPGPFISDDDLEVLLNEKISGIQDDDWLILSGSAPSCVSKNIYAAVAEKLADKNVHLVADAAGELLLSSLKYKPFLIKPNEFELSDIFSAKADSLNKVLTYAHKLQKMGAKNVLVSRGSKGALLADSDGKVNVTQSVPGRIVSSTGCGDSMLAGFVAGYIRSHDYEESLRLANACANATAFSQTLAEHAEIEEMYNSIYGSSNNGGLWV